MLMRKLFFSLLALLITMSSVAATKKIYIQNQTGWESLALYAWQEGKSDTDLLGAWPGTEVNTTETFAGTEYKVMEVDESIFPIHLILNNNPQDETSKQQVDLAYATLARNYYFDVTTDGYSEFNHLFVRNLSSWETLAVYAWGGSETFGNWPGKTTADGTTMIDNVEYLVYKFQYPGSQLNLIFNNSTGEGQKNDFEITEARDYYLTVSQANEVWEALSAVKRFRPSSCTPLEKVYCYAYKDASDFSSPWPGVELTPNAEGWYEYVIPKYATVIFNNGTYQTMDMPYHDGDPADEYAVWQGQMTDDGKMKTTNDPIADCLPYEREGLTVGRYGTICLPQAAVAYSGAEFYSVLGKELVAGSPVSIVIESVTSLQAGVPYLFYATADKLTVETTGEPLIEASTSNGLVGSFEQANIENNENHYILLNNELWKVNQSIVGANRAYFNLALMSEYNPAQPVQGIRKRMEVAAEDTPSGIEDVAIVNTSVRKHMVDGQMMIICGENTYNAQGQLIK